MRGVVVAMFPDFLCIGAQKSGTDWLYLNLRIHPEIWTAPIKELHHFDHPSSMPVITQLVSKSSRRAHLKRSIYRLIKERRKENIQWLGRYLLLPRNDIWYSSLFPPGLGQKAGEVTPAYAGLKENIVARINDLMPNLKIIYILRNPVHRTWSQTAMYSRNSRRQLENIRDDKLFEYFESYGVSRHSNYIRNLQTWEKFYPKTNFFIGFYDQLAENPRDFIRNIYNFLEVDSSEKVIPDTINKKINSHQYPEIPVRLSSYLSHRYYDQIKQLHQRFANRYTADWLKFAEHCINAE